MLPGSPAAADEVESLPVTGTAHMAVTCTDPAVTRVAAVAAATDSVSVAPETESVPVAEVVLFDTAGPAAAGGQAGPTTVDLSATPLLRVDSVDEAGDVTSWWSDAARNPDGATHTRVEVVERSVDGAPMAFRVWWRLAVGTDEQPVATADLAVLVALDGSTTAAALADAAEATDGDAPAAPTACAPDAAEPGPEPIPSTTDPSSPPASSVPAAPPPAEQPPAEQPQPPAEQPSSGPPAAAERPDAVPGVAPADVVLETATTVGAQPVVERAPAPVDLAVGTPPPLIDDEDHDSDTVDLPEAPEAGWPVRLIHFPVAGPVTYYDDWGNCRGGRDCPRRHKGNDLIGVRLQPLLAPRDGVVTHLVLDHPTAGWGLVITDADGWSYAFYHVNNDTPGTDDGADPEAFRLAPGLAVGSTVVAGQLVAYMGDSGNSEHSVPHLHFEIHRPDGTAVNPYQSLRLAEWFGQCWPGGTVDSALSPPELDMETMVAVATRTGKGEFWVGSLLYLAGGDAETTGWSRNTVLTPCEMPSSALLERLGITPDQLS